MNISNC